MTTYKFTIKNNSEHENTLNELMDLNNSFNMYYIDDNGIIYLDDNEQLLNAYDTTTDIFYLESENFNINYIDSLSNYIEIV
ncbi:hypothetical protein [Staphylococcus phage vB_SurM-PSU4]|nr:hypothetical protein [Staphylococcus phage vB_SurM-PSU4]